MADTDTLVVQTSTPVVISDTAAVEIKKILAQQDRDGLSLRIYVAGMGCSGPQYGMALDDNIEESDRVYEQSGIKIVIDSSHLEYLEGANVEWIDTERGAGFKIENPNLAPGDCASDGCGSGCSCGG
jgi:iron-sulfur cluster assembly accessory protein